MKEIYIENKKELELYVENLNKSMHPYKITLHSMYMRKKGKLAEDIYRFSICNETDKFVNMITCPISKLKSRSIKIKEEFDKLNFGNYLTMKYAFDLHLEHKVEEDLEFYDKLTNNYTTAFGFFHSIKANYIEERKLFGLHLAINSFNIEEYNLFNYPSDIDIDNANFNIFYNFYKNEVGLINIIDSQLLRPEGRSLNVIS